MTGSALPLLHVVEALVLKNGRILLAYNIDTWWLPGGKVEPGETFVDAAIRETIEETGIEVDPVDVVSLMERTTAEHHETWITVRCRYVEGEITLEDPDCKVTDARWVDLAAANELAERYPLELADLASRPGVAWASGPGP